MNRPGLGRGLGALIPTQSEAGARFAEIPVGSVTPNPRQPRQVFDEELLAELVASIREVGVLQPIVVRAVGQDRFELIMGERRLRASERAGLDTVPAVIRDTSDDDLLRDALLENLHRAELNPLEEAAAYQQLLEDFGCTQEELSARIGRSRPQIANTIRLLRLPGPVQRRVAAGVLSAGHARSLLGVEDPALQEKLASRVVAEGISVRQLEEIVRFGDESATPAARKLSTRPVDPRSESYASRLIESLDTRVRIEIGKSKGRIVIDFATIEDLSRIVDIIDIADED